MSGAIMNKVWGFLGMDPARDNEEDEEEVDNYEEKDIEEEIEEPEDRKIFGRRNNKVVSMPQVQQVKMAICQPTSFEQAEDICDLLKEKKSIIYKIDYFPFELDYSNYLFFLITYCFLLKKLVYYLIGQFYIQHHSI